MKKIKNKVKKDAGRKLSIGITIRIENATDSIWTNGIKQNSLTLHKMFLGLPNVKACKLINFGKAKKEDFKNTEWEPFANDIITPDDSINKENLDVVVTAMVSPSTKYIESAINKKIKLVKQIMGNEYEMFSEQVLFSYEGISQTNFYGKRKGYIANWLSPHFYNQNKDLMELISDAPAFIGPYIWDSKYVEHNAAILAKTEKRPSLTYIPSGKTERRISVFEPNLNLVKTCITPILAIERMYRKRPELVARSKIFCTSRIRKKNIFIEFVKGLDVYNNSKLTVENRFPIYFSLAKHTDIVLSHQRNLDLNYAYFDAAWLGYPLVHNSKTLEGLGYYYEGWNADKASDLLIEIAQTFDDGYKDYLIKSREYISRFFPDNKENIEKYTQLFEDLFK
jgi:hypothetical protein